MLYQPATDRTELPDERSPVPGNKTLAIAVFVLGLEAVIAITAAALASSGNRTTMSVPGAPTYATSGCN